MSDVKQSSVTFGSSEQFAARNLIECALSEDLGNAATIGDRFEDYLADVFSVTTIDSELNSIPDELDRDLTCAALVDPTETATINVIVRREGVLAGSCVAELVFNRLDPAITWETLVSDGTFVASQTTVARVTGSLRSLLIGERTALNFLMHLSGIATQTRKFVEAVAGTKAVILDTRKTLPGWRALEKYAVRCGGGTNHRMGLYDGVLIKDNHIAAWVRGQGKAMIADAVRQARAVSPNAIAIEVEVDTLEQLRDALGGQPEIVLLDNMEPPMLREAVRMRDGFAPSTMLEASGGITLANVREIAETGIDRVSVGALTHSAVALDLAFDWPN